MVCCDGVYRLNWWLAPGKTNSVMSTPAPPHLKLAVGWQSSALGQGGIAALSLSFSSLAAQPGWEERLQNKCTPSGSVIHSVNAEDHTQESVGQEGG